MAIDALDFDVGTVLVTQPPMPSRSKPVFAPPKGGKLRDVSLPEPIADALRVRMKAFRR